MGGKECSECGSRMVPTLHGLRCPRLAACGRGGVEEVGKVLKDGRRSAVDKARA